MSVHLLHSIGVHIAACMCTQISIGSKPVSDANSPGVKVGTKGAAIQDYNLPGNTVIAPIKIDSGWGFGHWQSWADADNIATTTSNAGNAFTNLGIMQPSLYLNYVVKV